MPSCFFKGWAFGFYNVMLSGVFKAVLLGNTLQFRVIAEIFQGGFVVFQQQFSKVHFEAATTHNAHHHDVGGFTAELFSWFMLLVFRKIILLQIIFYFSFNICMSH